PVVDLTELPAEEREQEARRRAAEEAATPFNLNTDLPIRLKLLRLEERRHLLLMTIHHIAFDGWSMGIFLRELAGLYTAFREDAPSPLPPLPVQYADFALWQREWLQGKELERQ